MVQSLCEARPLVSLATKDNPHHSWLNRERIFPSSLQPSKRQKRAWTKKKEGGKKHILHCFKTPLPMVALASFHPVPNILFLGKPTKQPLHHTSLLETTNHWSLVQSRVRAGCARNHLDTTKDSLFAADEQRNIQGAGCGFQHCQPQDTIVPYKEILKTVVTWFKFPVEEGIKEHW